MTVTVRTYDGSSYTTVSNETITLDADDGSVGKNVNTDENGNAYILYNNVDLGGDNGYFISVVARDVSESKRQCPLERHQVYARYHCADCDHCD